MSEKVYLDLKRGFLIDSEGYDTPFRLVDKESPLMRAVHEVNEACEHIQNAIHLIIQNGEQVVIRVDRINNFRDDMSPDDVVFLLMAIALPYFDSQCFTEVIENKWGVKTTSSRLDLVRLSIGRSLDTNKRLIEWFINKVLERTTTHDQNRWQCDLSWREHEVVA